MACMGDITPVKILIVAVVALLVLGPEKLPEMTRKAGKAWADFHKFRESMESQVRETVGDVPGLSDLTKLTRLTNVGIKSTIASSLNGVVSAPTTITSSPDQARAELTPAAAPGTTASATAGPAVPASTGYEVAAPSVVVPRSRPSGAAPAEPLFAADDPSFN